MVFVVFRVERIFDSAVAARTPHGEQPNSQKKGIALWYAALLELEEGKTQIARDRLLEISSNSYPTTSQAKKLLKELDALN